MRINTERNCKSYSCDRRSSIMLQPTKSMNVTKTNTLHQFDASGIIGVPSPVGKVPIVFYMKEGEGHGRRGIVYYDDYDSVCFMYPENEHAGWCVQPYDMKYDAVVPFDNGVESGMRRNHGIFELWVSVFRRWYNGQVMYRPTHKIQMCGGDDDGYPTRSTEETLKEKTRTKAERRPNKNRTINHHCNCRKEQ